MDRLLSTRLSPQFHIFQENPKFTLKKTLIKLKIGQLVATEADCSGDFSANKPVRTHRELNRRENHETVEGIFVNTVDR